MRLHLLKKAELIRIMAELIDSCLLKILCKLHARKNPEKLTVLD